MTSQSRSHIAAREAIKRCTPGFSHKSGIAVRYGVSEVFTSERNNSGKNGQPEDFCTEQWTCGDFQRCTNSKWLIDGFEQKKKRTPRCALTMFCLLSYRSLQQFLRYACGIKQVYVIINTMLTIQWCQVDDIRNCINNCDPHCNLITQFGYEFTLTKRVFCHLLGLMCSMWSIDEGLQFSY